MCHTLVTGVSFLCWHPSIVRGNRQNERMRMDFDIGSFRRPTVRERSAFCGKGSGPITSGLPTIHKLDSFLGH